MTMLYMVCAYRDGEKEPRCVETFTLARDAEARIEAVLNGMSANAALHTIDMDKREIVSTELYPSRIRRDTPTLSCAYCDRLIVKGVDPVYMVRNEGPHDRDEACCSYHCAWSLTRKEIEHLTVHDSEYKGLHWASEAPNLSSQEKTMLLTHSSMKMFNTCPRAFKLRYLDRLTRPIVHRNAASALRFGSIVHQGLANHWRGRPLLEGIKVLPSHDDDAVEIDAIDATPDTMVIEDAQALAMIEAYHEHYTEDGNTYDVESIEAPFETPHYKGQVDGVVLNRDGVRLLLEHKTASKADEVYWAHLNIDMQIRLYCHAIEADAVLYDVLIKPAIRQKKTESNAEFLARYKQEITFERRTIYLDEDDIAEAMRDAFEIRKQIENSCFPKSRGACTTVASCCPYFDLCAGLKTVDDYEVKEADEEIEGAPLYRRL